MHNTNQQQAAIDANQYSAAQVSKFARQIGFGLAGFALAMLVSDASFPKLLASQHRTQLLVISGAGVLAVLTDYLQYLCGYIASRRLLQKPQPKTPALSLMAKLFFVVKQFLALAGGASLVDLIGSVLLNP